MKPCFAGLDWATATHTVCAIDPLGAVKARFEIAHTAAGLQELLARLRSLAPEPAQLPIAIERPSGLLVDTDDATGLATRVQPLRQGPHLEPAIPEFVEAPGKA